MNYVHDTLEPGEAPFAVERPDFGQPSSAWSGSVSGEQYIGQDRRTPAVLAHRATHVASVVLLNDLPFVATLFALAGFVLLLLTTGVARGSSWRGSSRRLCWPGLTAPNARSITSSRARGCCAGLAVAFTRLAEWNAREQASRRCCSCWRCRCCAIRWRIRQASSPTADVESHLVVLAARVEPIPCGPAIRRLRSRRHGAAARGRGGAGRELGRVRDAALLRLRRTAAA